MEATAHAKLSEAIDLGKDWAIKMFFEYMYGKPKQIIEQTNINPERPKIVFVNKSK
jgi:hypothetical protein